ncbi:PH domain-containing protein [Kitasatospora sp. NPDC002040]|uniref:PH domain-containing protein n=1 Tax=Kitasatospora sp. NPDC002040 TaxID=3154661 RepID=UPI00333242A4
MVLAVTTAAVAVIALVTVSMVGTGGYDIPDAELVMVGAIVLAMSLMAAAVLAPPVSYLVRPVKLAVGSEGIRVRLPLSRTRTVPWEQIRRVDLVSYTSRRSPQPMVVIESGVVLGPSAANWPAAAFGRLVAVANGNRAARGLVFGTALFAFDAFALFATVQGQAPQSVVCADFTANPVRSGVFQPGPLTW